MMLMLLFPLVIVLDIIINRIMAIPMNWNTMLLVYGRENIVIIEMIEKMKEEESNIN
jgi:hypothetical protein